MAENNVPKLLVSREEAREKIEAQIEEGQRLYNREISSGDELSRAWNDFGKWSDYNKTLLSSQFDTSSVADDYQRFNTRAYGTTSSVHLTTDIKRFRSGVDGYITHLEGICDKLELYEETHNMPKQTSGDKVFVGHGRSQC